MATSIIDYVFRELAVSYLERHDLAHAQPHDLLPDAMGDGEQGEKFMQIAEMAGKTVSKGFVRSSNLYFLKNHGKNKEVSTSTAEIVQAPVAMSANAGGSNMAMQEEVKVTRVTEVTESRRGAVHMARTKGYQGDACGECGNFTLLRNGTCLKCDTCGSTSGCS